MRPHVFASPPTVGFGQAPVVAASARIYEGADVRRFSARGHAGGRVIALRTAFVLSENAPRAWIHCAVFGSFEGHPSGAFTFDRAVFASLCKNFAARKTPVPLTYEHPMYRGDGQPIPAAGFIHELAVRDDGLWALVEWTPAGAEYVRRGEYRYCSVVVGEALDRVSGEPVGMTLFEVGLTNQPFIDGLTPITLPATESADAA